MMKNFVKVLITALFALAPIISFCFNIVDQKKTQEKIKRVLIFRNDSRFELPYNTASPLREYISWYLNDPLLLSESKLSITQLTSNDGSEIDLTDETISSYDLVIIPFPHHIKKENLNNFLSYIEKGGAFFLVQPTFDPSDQAKALDDNLGIILKGWEDNTSASSCLTDHPSNRILGLPEGKSVYPHKMYQPHMKFDVQNGIVLTRLSCGGDPDLFFTSNGRIAVMTTDIVNDLQSTDPEYPDIEKDFRYLFINSIRKLLGFGFFEQPVQTPQQKWSELFYAFAATKEYVISAGKTEPFSTRLSEDEMKSIIKKADDDVVQAARFLVKGKYAECKSLFDSSVKRLSESMDKMTQVKRFFIRGWHGSILTPDYYGGGLLGYAEVEWQDHVINWMKKQIDWVTRTGSRRLIDIFPNDWEIMAPYYPEDIKLIKTAIKDGRLETVNGMYSAAYLPILSEESNIRQFHYGLNGFRKVFDSKVETFICPSDHFDFHPQLPQILNSYGYKNALVNEASMGTLLPIPADIIFWKGLNGSEIVSIPQLKGITNNRNWLNPISIAQADQLGYRSIVIGIPSFDATYDFPGERESSLINPIAPISGTWVNAQELFERAPKPEKSFYLGVDELWANKVDFWSSWGWMNEASEWNRTTENKILAAEKLSVIAAVTGKVSMDFLKSARLKMDLSWKNLLRTQDHMLYGSVDYTNQIPPATLKPEEKKMGKHAWGYDFPLLHDSLHSVGAMENYCETRAANIGSPRIPGSRYERAKSFIKESQDSALNIFSNAFESLFVDDGYKGFNSKIIPLVVFNQLGWAKNDIVTIEKEFSKGELFNFSLTDGKIEIPYQIITKEDHKDGSIKKISVIFKAEIPSLGYKAYYLKPLKKATSLARENTLKNTNARLENEYYIIEIDSVHGGITRIFDKELGLEMVNKNSPGNELYSPSTPSASSKDVKASITLSMNGELGSTISIKSKVGGAIYECAISLYKNIKRIDFNLDVDYGKAGLNFGSFEDSETGLYVQFPLNFGGRLYVNQPFGVYETQKEMQVGLDFADLYQGKYGLALINRNSPAYHYKDGVLSICLTRGKPLITGKKNYKYSVYTHKENLFEGDTYTIAKSLNTPYIVFWPGIVVGSLEPVMSFLSVDRPNIVLSALYSDGEKIFARFYERSGKAEKVKIGLPYLRTMECARVELNGKITQEVKNLDGKIELDFKPWEIITLAFSENL